MEPVERPPFASWAATLQALGLSLALSSSLSSCIDVGSGLEPGGAGGAGAGGSGGAGGAGGGVGGSSGEGGAGGLGGAGGAPPPSFDASPWETGDVIGFGVARKDTQSPLGDHVFIGYAGFGIPLDAAQAWVRELWQTDLRDRGVRYVFAVQGPAAPGYEGLEIGNSKISAWLTQNVAADAWVLAVGHSSGSYVAHELFGQLAGGADPAGVTVDKVVFFSLDGGSGLSAPAVDRLRAAWFVGALDGVTGTASPNRATMKSMAATYASLGASYWELDATGSGCDAGASWCVHMTPIITLPHDPAGGDVTDYADFAERPVTTAYIEAHALEGGLLP